MSTKPEMRIECWDIHRPDAVGMPWFDPEHWVVVVYRTRCDRGCVGTFQTLVDRQCLREADTMAALDESALDVAQTHVCLVKST